VVNLRGFIEEVRWKNADVPIYVYGETKTSRHLPNDILRELHGFIHMFEDTPEFVARTSSARPRATWKAFSPRFSKPCWTTPKTAPTAGTARATQVAWRF
jgi:arginine decarboxylase